MLFSVVISYNNVHEFTNNLLTLYEIKALTRMKSEINLKIYIYIQYSGYKCIKEFILTVH